MSFCSAASLVSRDGVCGVCGTAVADAAAVSPCGVCRWLRMAALTLDSDEGDRRGLRKLVED